MARGSNIELIKIDPENGKMSSVVVWNCFALVRDLQAFRLTGGSKGEDKYLNYI